MEIEELISREVCLSEGIFFTRQSTVDNILRNFDFSKIHTIVDSAAGSCNFLVPLAQRYPEKNFYGIEKNKDVFKATQEIVKKYPNIYYYLGDAVLDSFDIPLCDLYIGNPPFLNFSDLPDAYRNNIVSCWKHYFSVEKGFRLLLGISRGDIAQLIFSLTIDKYLKKGGSFGVILPDSLLHGNEASAGFRDFSGICVDRIVDLSNDNPFDYTKRDCFYILGKKGGETSYPLCYEKNKTETFLFKSGTDLVEDSEHFLSGTHYQPRQGINTLGANKVFIFKDQPPFSSPLIFPLLKSSDIREWDYRPSYSILMPYRKGKILEEDQLLADYPEEYRYLLKHKDALKTRKSRFAQKYWYALFGVGSYTFAPYKVVWRGLGAHKLQAAVVKEAIPNQAMHCYFSFQSKEEAYYVCGIMNSDLYRRQILLLNKSGAKSFGQPSTIKKIRLDDFQPENPLHQKLVVESLRMQSDPKRNKACLNQIVQDIYASDVLFFLEMPK